MGWYVVILTGDEKVMRYERETGDITCSPGSQLAASSQHWLQGMASAGLEKLGGTLPEQVGRMYQNHHGFEPCATALGS